MAVVRMDIDQAQTTITTMTNTMSGFSEQLNMLTNSVNELLNGWEGHAQTQFNGAWSDWYSRFQSAINELEPMISGLTTERQQLIEADSSSSF